MKLAILGTGRIVGEVLPVLKEINGIELSVILSTPRSLKKAQKLTEIYGVSQAGSDYDSILVNPDVDIVYVTPPNHLHYDHAKETLFVGRYVICEKPFTLILAGFEDLAKIAEQNNRILLGAITNQYLGSFAAIKGSLAKFGDIKIVECSYSQYPLRYDALKCGEIVPAFDPEKGGGVLYDLSTYSIYLVVGLPGKPGEVQYLADMEYGADASNILTVDYGHSKAVYIDTKDCAAEIKLTIQGSEGLIAIIGAMNILPGLVSSLNNQNITMINESTLNHCMYDGFVAFRAIVEQKDMMVTKLASEHSRAVMGVSDTAANGL